MQNYKNIENEFVSNYYKNMSISGIVNNLGIFTEKALCILNNEELIGAYYVLIRMAQNNINRILYKNVIHSCEPTDNGYIIKVSGNCQLVNFQNQIIKECGFSETFFISYNYKITNYIGHYF